jgi:ribonuclease P protein component
VAWLPTEESAPAPFQFLISVPKSQVPLAADRNKIRRRIREAYRLNKGILREGDLQGAPGAAFCIIYRSHEILPFTKIQEKIILILHRLLKENEKVTR